MDMYEQVVRERQTETRLRQLDMHEIVAEIHSLEDRIEQLEEALDES